MEPRKLKTRSQHNHERPVPIVERLEDRISLSNGNFPPGQFPSGNPAQAPGNSNPNENGGPKTRTFDPSSLFGGGDDGVLSL